MKQFDQKPVAKNVEEQIGALNSKTTYSITDMTTTDPVQAIKNNIAAIVAMTDLRTLKIYTSQLEYIAVCDTFPGSVLSETYNSFYITGYDGFCHHLYRYNGNWIDDNIGALNSKITTLENDTSFAFGNFVILGAFSASGASSVTKIQDCINKVVTNNHSTAFVGIPAASGNNLVVGYVYSNKDYGGGFICDSTGFHSWTLSGGTITVN